MELRNSADCQKLTDFPSLTVHIFMCVARAVVSWAFVSIGFTLRWPGTILMLVFSCSKYFRRRSQAEIFFRARKTVAVWFLYPEFYVTLFRFPFSPSFTWKKKKKKAKFGTYTKMTAFSIMMFFKSVGASRGGNIPAGLEQVRSPGHGLLLNLWFTLQQD